MLLIIFSIIVVLWGIIFFIRNPNYFKERLKTSGILIAAVVILFVIIFVVIKLLSFLS